MKAILLQNLKDILIGTEVDIIGSSFNKKGCFYECKLPNGECLFIQSYLLKIVDKTPYIDWEQRRYEIAKAALHDYTRPREERYISDAEYAAIVAVEYADELIKRLKK